MPEEIELPFKTETFKEAWDEWMAYRKEGKLRKYVPRGLQKTFAALVRQSGNNEAVAIAMINQSMELNYQGIFPLKNQSNGTPRQGSNPAGKLGTSEARIATAKKW